MKYKVIHLSRGGRALVDPEDYKWLAPLTTWFLSNGYAMLTRGGRKPYRKDHQAMHRLIASVHFKDYSAYLDVDHINGKRHDNRKQNLRMANRSQNFQNRGKYKSNTSGYKGVSWVPKDKSWKAVITLHGKVLYLKQTKNVLIAARAYDQAARKYFGEFANTNFNN